MSENTNLPLEDELTALKARADLMGIQYHPSIGVDKLKEKIRAALADGPAETPAAPAASGSETPAQKKARIRAEATALVRIRVTCMNPAKKEWPGEIFTTGNGAVGTLKKYVPYNAEDGWHVPQMILTMLQERKCQVFVSEKSKNGITVRRGKLIKEFGIEILPPLTKEELHELAQRQLMAAGA
jgi:hypothetical protein